MVTMSGFMEKSKELWGNCAKTSTQRRDSETFHRSYGIEILINSKFDLSGITIK